MKRFLLIISLFICSQTTNAKDWAAVQILACEPQWGDLASQIVGDKAKVVIATNQFQNPRFIQENADLIANIRKADILFCSGSNLEAAWLPTLLTKTSTKKIQVGGSGYFMASDYVQKLDDMPVADDQKTNNAPKNTAKNSPQFLGNPYVHLNPNNIPPIANEFLKRMIAIDPANAQTYQENYDKFIAKWNLAIIKWEIKAKNLKNMPVIVTNNQWAYLIDWLGLKVVARLQEKADVPPTTQYLYTVLKQVEQNRGEMIIYAPYEQKDAIMWFSEKSGTKVALLPFTIYGTPKAKNLFEMFDETLNILAIRSANVVTPTKSLINNTKTTNQP